jgi:hypothetical protein
MWQSPVTLQSDRLPVGRCLDGVFLFGPYDDDRRDKSVPGRSDPINQERFLLQAGGIDWKGKGEDCSSIFLTGDIDCAPMEPKHLLGNSEPQTGSLGPWSFLAIDLRECVEYLVKP